MGLKTWVVAGIAMAVLSACALGTSKTPVTNGASDGAATPATSVRLVDRDVEAPEVFQATDKGLWDGGPSLGGVWVASPDATTPERVLMRNPANGKFVIGGLFQRDASLPGPKLQLSSDAADALGLLAGEPAEISVTALRREDAATPKPDASSPLLDTNESQGATVATPDIAANAAAAINVAPTTTKPATKPKLVAPTLAQTAPQLSGALIQIGIFSVETNASRASQVLIKAGIPVSVNPETSLGKPLWSVTTRGDAALLAKIKAAGFKDAYVLRR